MLRTIKSIKNSYFVIFFLTFLLFNFKTANGETIYNGTLIDAHSQVGILISNEEVSKEDIKIEEKGLFDIKSLNGIEDRVIRGTLKKIYMAGKKASKSSADVINDMKQQLDSDGKLTDELTKFLEGIQK